MIVQNAAVVDNFLFWLEQYFNVVGVPNEASKIGTTLTFFWGVVQLLWQRKHGEMDKGICAIDTWANFK